MSRVKRGVVWSDPKNESEMIQSGNIELNNDTTNKIAKDISEIISNLIGNNYEDKMIITKLIYHAILEQIKQYIREYDNIAAKDIGTSLFDWSMDLPFKVFDNVNIDFDHARHAKLSSAGEYIKNYINSLTNVDVIMNNMIYGNETLLDDKTRVLIKKELSEHFHKVKFNYGLQVPDDKINDEKKN